MRTGLAIALILLAGCDGPVHAKNVDLAREYCASMGGLERISQTQYSVTADCKYGSITFRGLRATD